MNKLIGHLKTVHKHRSEVRKLCFKAGLYWQGLTHDLSKYSPAEFIPGVRYFEGTRSPQVQEREELGFSPAWLHHQGRNKHHFEYWMDYVSHAGLVPVQMPKKYIVEMVCDRIAACKTYQKEAFTQASPYEYYEKMHDHYLIHPETDQHLKNLLKMYMDIGEEKTMEYIRKEFLKK